MKTVNILGTDYNIYCNDLSKENRDAYCDFNSKEIHISKDVKGQYLDFLIKHEIVHAFLFESGLEELCNNETIVSWIALQFKKIEKVFRRI